MEVAAPGEQTKPGRIFTPAVDIFETEKEIALLADLPGVKAGGLTIDLRDDTLTLTGEVKPFEGPDEEDILEAISKKGFWFKVKAVPSFNPQAYSSMSRT